MGKVKKLQTTKNSSTTIQLMPIKEENEENSDSNQENCVELKSSGKAIGFLDFLEEDQRKNCQLINKQLSFIQFNAKKKFKSTDCLTEFSKKSSTKLKLFRSSGSLPLEKKLNLSPKRYEKESSISSEIEEN